MGLQIGRAVDQRAVEIEHHGIEGQENGCSPRWSG
jgi:hypothetical protein